MSTEHVPPQVVLPQMCDRHQNDLIVRKLKLDESAPWRVAITTAQIMLFSWTSGDRRVMARTGDDANNLSLVLNEIGCLACYDHSAYARVIRVLRKGLSHAAQVAQGKATDPDWPLDARAKGDA